MDYYRDKTAIVTGGASGIGRALCEALGRYGATILVADVDADGAESVAERIRARGGRANAKRLDVADGEAVRRLVNETAEGSGRLDFMFNNAGIGIGGEVRDMTAEQWRRIIDINLWGVIHGTLAAYETMAQQGHGHIVNTASAAGLMPVPGESAYATTKFGVVGLSSSLRGEGEALGVRVSAVCPGWVRTNILVRSEIMGADPDAVRATLPKRMVEPPQAAEIILQGVARNRAIIVFPFSFRLLWWGYRLWPPLLEALGRRVIRGFRQLPRRT